VKRPTHDLLDFVRVGCGILAGFAAFVSFGVLGMKMQDLATGWAAGSYKPADFTVEWAVLDDEMGYYAVGTVDGRRERLPLRDVVPRPARQEDLDKAVPGGQSLRVGYAPAATATTFNGASLRIVPWQDDLTRVLRERALVVLVWAYGPLLLLAVLSVAASLAIRKPWAPPLAMAFFFLLFEVMAFALIVGVDVMQRAS
jgi:hypothetical protein